MKKHFFLVIVLFFSSIFSKAHSQNRIDSLKSVLNNKDSNKTERFDACHKLIMENYFYSSLDSAYIYIQQLEDFTISQQLEDLEPKLNLLKGLMEYKLINYRESFNYYNLSLKQFKEKRDTTGIISAMNNIGLLYNNEFRFKESIKYLKQALVLANKLNNPEEKLELYGNLGLVFNNSFKVDSSYVYLKKAVKIADKYSRPKEFILKEIGNNFVKRKMYDSSQVYFQKALKESKSRNNIDILALTNFAISTQYIFQKKFKQSIPFAEKALFHANSLSDNVTKKGSLLNLYEAYKELNNNEMALYYLEKVNLEDDIIEQVNFNRNLQKFEIKQIKLRDSLNNEKRLFKKDLEYKKDKRILQTTWIAVLIILLLVSISVYIIQKREKKILSQNVLISEERLNNHIKEEELRSINAMVEGQEKERLKIANDLHDDLGSLMAIIKMQFETFKNKDSNNLFQRTNELIEEAYQKIRNIAHAKNSGVLTKQGLYKAIKKHAKSISELKDIKVRVIENGLHQRLENSVELTIFRIIQELIANVIKHADATEVDIYLNENDDLLNIMVEDNGKGFDTAEINKNSKGMGLSSIKRRVEDLEGKMIIESQPNYGTSIIIDIPL